MISNHVMRMPAIRHQLQMEAMTAAQRNALNQAQQETERAQAENYRASSRKSNSAAALDEDELTAAKELQGVLSAPDAIQTNANGSVTISPTATGSLLATLARAGTRGRNFGAGSRDLLTARNAPAEAEANRVATGERNKYSVDERELTRREAPIELNDNARLVTPAGEALGGLGLHRLGPDQTLLGDVPGVELNRLGTGIQKLATTGTRGGGAYDTETVTYPAVPAVEGTPATTNLFGRVTPGTPSTEAVPGRRITRKIPAAQATVDLPTDGAGAANAPVPAIATFDDENTARASGAKSGDVIMLKGVGKVRLR